MAEVARHGITEPFCFAAIATDGFSIPNLDYRLVNGGREFE
ncbi:MAG: hypothetical protein VW547_16495 [Alphaproteobacteria bacterium]